MSQYQASDIEVLEGLEPVRTRPAMYIGGTDGTGYHHLLWEILDNSVDEAMNGHADKVEVRLGKDYRTATVADNGRGIPVDKHPKFKKPAVELILTTLHAGGKFNSENYAFSGGLHGVGSSVVNALSEALEVTIRRDGHEYVQAYSRGRATTKLKKTKPVRGQRGTAISFVPDPQIFGKKASFDPKRVRTRLLAKSYLHKGLKVVFVDEKAKTREEFLQPNGLSDYLNDIVTSRGKPAVHGEQFFVERDDAIRLELAMQWTEAPDEHVRSYANGIPTESGGTHENGLRQALGKAIRGYLQAHKMTPKGVTVTADDIREGLVAVLSIYVQDPQFQGQTKDRLNNPEVTAAVEQSIRTALEDWLHANKSVAEAVIARIVLAARAREASRAATQQVVKRSAVSHRMNLPWTLADCASTNAGETVLFLVEGDSAGGSAKQGRNRKRQAILPLRGKVLNAERATAAQVLANKELQNIVTALGCGIGKSFDIRQLRYGRIFLLMDADSDGHHISTLLLTFFFRMLPGLVREGHVYLAQPPLYRIDVGKETYWALDDSERDQVLAGLAKNAKPSISRFKGLGEMTAQELWETTLDPARRRALRVVVDAELEADRVLSELLGKDPQDRFRFIMERATSLTSDELDV